MSEKYLKVSTATTISASSSPFLFGSHNFQAGLEWMEEKQPFLLVLKTTQWAEVDGMNTQNADFIITQKT